MCKQVGRCQNGVRQIACLEYAHGMPGISVKSTSINKKSLQKNHCFVFVLSRKGTKKNKNVISPTAKVTLLHTAHV